MKLVITGGAGFIGSALCRLLIAETEADIVNIDKLTYAASPQAMAGLEGRSRVPQLRAITTADYPTPAARPANSRLSSERAAALFGLRLPPLEASLADCLERLRQSPGEST